MFTKIILVAALAASFSCSSSTISSATISSATIKIEELNENTRLFNADYKFLSEEDTQKLVDILKSPINKLEELIFGKDSSISTVSKVFNTLKDPNCKLHSIDLRDNITRGQYEELAYVEDQKVNAIADGLRHSTTLKSLVLYNNTLGNDRLKTIIEGLIQNQNSKLSHLDIRKNNITNVGLAWIISTLASIRVAENKTSQFNLTIDDEIKPGEGYEELKELIKHVRETDKSFIIDSANPDFRTRQ